MQVFYPSSEVNMSSPEWYCPYCKYDANALERAAFIDHLQCLKYAHQAGHLWSEKVYSNAIPLARETYSRSRHYKHWIDNLKAILEYCMLHKQKTCKSGKCFHKKKKVAVVL